MKYPFNIQSLILLAAVLLVGSAVFMTRDVMTTSFSAVGAESDPVLERYFLEQVDARQDHFRIKFRDAQKGDFDRLFSLLRELALVRSNTDVYQIDATAFYRFKTQTFDIELSYRMNSEEYDQVMQWIRERMDPFLADDPRRIDTLKFIHDSIVKQSEYDKDYEKKSAYNAVFDQMTLCEGYASLARLMLNYAQIDNRLISGQANGVNHVWNLVRFEQNWYHIDFTWDDPVFESGQKDPDFVIYDFYLKSDQTMEKTHQWDKSKYPEATSDWQ